MRSCIMFHRQAFNFITTLIKLSKLYKFDTLSPEALNKHLGLRVGPEVQVVFVSDGKVEQHHLI